MRNASRLTLLFGAALLAATALSACSGGDDADPGVLVPPTSPAATTPAGADPSPRDTGGQARDVADKFLSALVDGNYEKIWGMLADPTKGAWGTEGAFAAFLVNKYGGDELDFQVGESQALTEWTDPETLLKYATATSVAYALEVDRQPVDAFLLAPVVVVPENAGLSIAGLGPAARRSPVMTPLGPATAEIDMPILVYHHVALGLPDDAEQASITVTTDQFDAELSELEADGYHTITAAELVNHLYYGLPLPEKPVMLTFDDGYEDACTHATRILNEHGMVGSFGLISGYMGGTGYLTWDQAREMVAAGMEIVSHSVMHPDLGQITPEQAAQEIQKSKADIETNLGVPIQTLIYPYGEPFAYGTEEAQQRITALLHDSGYAAAITNPLPGSYPNIVQDGALPYQFHRLMVSPGMSLERFATRLTGGDIR